MRDGVRDGVFLGQGMDDKVVYPVVAVFGVAAIVLSGIAVRAVSSSKTDMTQDRTLISATIVSLMMMLAAVIALHLPSQVSILRRVQSAMRGARKLTFTRKFASFLGVLLIGHILVPVISLCDYPEQRLAPLAVVVPSWAISPQWIMAGSSKSIVMFGASLGDTHGDGGEGWSWGVVCDPTPISPDDVFGAFDFNLNQMLDRDEVFRLRQAITDWFGEDAAEAIRIITRNSAGQVSKTTFLEFWSWKGGVVFFRAADHGENQTTATALCGNSQSAGKVDPKSATGPDGIDLDRLAFDEAHRFKRFLSTKQIRGVSPTWAQIPAAGVLACPHSWIWGFPFGWATHVLIGMTYVGSRIIAEARFWPRHSKWPLAQAYRVLQLGCGLPDTASMFLLLAIYLYAVIKFDALCSYLFIIEPFCAQLLLLFLGTMRSANESVLRRWEWDLCQRINQVIENNQGEGRQNNDDEDSDDGEEEDDDAEEASDEEEDGGRRRIDRHWAAQPIHVGKVRCPLCRKLSPVDRAVRNVNRVAEVTNVEVCCICLDAQPNVCLACGHLCLCEHCFVQIAGNPGL